MNITYIIRRNPKVAAIKGNTPALRKMVDAIATPVLGMSSEQITRAPVAILTGIKVVLET